MNADKIAKAKARDLKDLLRNFERIASKKFMETNPKMMGFIFKRLLHSRILKASGRDIKLSEFAEAFKKSHKEIRITLIDLALSEFGNLTEYVRGDYPYRYRVSKGYDDKLHVEYIHKTDEKILRKDPLYKTKAYDVKDNPKLQRHREWIYRRDRYQTNLEIKHKLLGTGLILSGAETVTINLYQLGLSIIYFCRKLQHTIGVTLKRLTDPEYLLISSTLEDEDDEEDYSSPISQIRIFITFHGHLLQMQYYESKMCELFRRPGYFDYLDLHTPANDLYVKLGEFIAFMQSYEFKDYDKHLDSGGMPIEAIYEIWKDLAVSVSEAAGHLANLASRVYDVSFLRQRKRTARTVMNTHNVQMKPSLNDNPFSVYFYIDYDFNAPAVAKDQLNRSFVKDRYEYASKITSKLSKFTRL